MENKKLIILGNGFDLASSLQSTYYDFFSQRFTEELTYYLENVVNEFKIHLYNKEYHFRVLFDTDESFSRRSSVEYNLNLSNNSYGSTIYEQIANSKLTFWDLVLYYSKTKKEIKNYDWQDVENRMLDFLDNPDKLKSVPSLKGMRYFFKGVSNDQNIPTQLCLYLAYFFPKREKQYTKENFIDYLYDELRLFEQAFADYIISISNESYVHKALAKICKITGKPLPECEDKIFSFNYTDPFSKYDLDIINVHGKASTNSILFGIDQENISPDSEIFRFTKTFRQMTETKLAKTYQDSILPDKDEVEEVIFFGHSLSGFDYSYFQTIFDHYDLYESSVKLIFYYETYGEKTPQDMELDLADKISRLLNSYSPSIDNPKKGRNLTHKLLLEKRLSIEELK